MKDIEEARGLGAVQLAIALGVLLAWIGMVMGILLLARLLQL